VRQWLYDVLTGDPDVAALVGSRVHQGESILRAPTKPELPMLVYRFGNVTSERLGQGSTANRVFFQVYVHDKPADYTRIDQICAALIGALHQSGPFPGEHILDTIWLETSRDLDDEYFQSVMRYVRFQSTLAA